MHIEVTQQGESYHLVGVNEHAVALSFDSKTDLGGQNKGMRPMQAVLAALGSCSAIDVISILKKQREPIANLKIEIDAERRQGEIPSLFRSIHMKFVFGSNIGPEKARKAVNLSLEKYCSVAMLLKPTTDITYETVILANHE